MSPILGSLGAVAVKGFRALETVITSLIDNFNRTTSGSLGTPSGGGTWIATKGTWNANGTQATSADAASTYPIASAEMNKKDVTINLDVSTSGGAGISFWITDAQNWWGLFPYTNTVTSYFSSCNSYSQGTACTAYTQGTGCNGWTSTSVCNGWTSTSSCNSWTSSSSCNGYAAGYNIFYQVYYQYCTGWSGGGSTCNGWTGGSACNSWVPGSSCNSWTYTQSCSTYSYTSNCNSYSQGTSTSAGTKTLRLIKSVSNVITTVVDQTIASLPASLKLITSGTSITGRAYSGAGQTTQIGTDLTSVQTAGGTKHGIILAPGGYTQGTTVDNISIT